MIKTEANILDRIDVRYAVEAHFEFGRRDFFVAKASFQITCGVYDGPPTTAMMADLIQSRGVHDMDIVDLTGTDHSKEIVAAMIQERGVKAEDIRSMTIAAVMVDDEDVAESM